MKKSTSNGCATARDHERAVNRTLTESSAGGGQTASMTPPPTAMARAACFEADLLRHMPRLRAFAMGLAGRRDVADDLVQETLLRALKARERFVPGSNLQAWLFTILRNAYLTRAGRDRRLRQDPDGVHVGSLSASPEQEWRLHYREMLKALARLRPHHREALLLVVAAGMSYEEAAAVSGCPVNTMKSRVKRAREALASAIDFDGTLGNAADVQGELATRAVR